MRVGDISFVAPFRYTALLWAILLGYLVFGDVPDLPMIDRLGRSSLPPASTRSIANGSSGRRKPAAESTGASMAPDGCDDGRDIRTASRSRRRTWRRWSLRRPSVRWRMNIFLPSLPGMARYFARRLRRRAAGACRSIWSPRRCSSSSSARLPTASAGGRSCWSRFAHILAGDVRGDLCADNVHVLLACRMLQAFAAAGIVLSRAVVRDTVETDDAASKIGYITMGMSVAPMIGAVDRRLPRRDSTAGRPASG